MSGSEHKEASQTHQANHAAAGAESGASVDKIRDILFGTQIKNYEARFTRLEENPVRETVELKETMRQRFESLEGFFKSEAEALAARLKAEREERRVIELRHQKTDRALLAALSPRSRRRSMKTRSTARRSLRQRTLASGRVLTDRARPSTRRQ